MPEPNSGCWLWTGGASLVRGVDWRPFICLDNKHRSAHRVSYEIFVGPIPDGKMICHKCDVTLCVNPDHLYAGTAKQNSADNVQRKRHHAQKHPELSQEVGRNLINKRILKWADEKPRCLTCGEQFVRMDKTQKFCGLRKNGSHRCSQLYRNKIAREATIARRIARAVLTAARSEK